MLRGCDLWYAGFPGLLTYSKYKNGRRFKDFKEVADRFKELDDYVEERKTAFFCVEKAAAEIKYKGMMTPTVRRIFDDGFSRLKNEIDSFGRERDMALRAKEDYPTWESQQRVKHVAQAAF